MLGVITPVGVIRKRRPYRQHSADSAPPLPPLPAALHAAASLTTPELSAPPVTDRKNKSPFLHQRLGSAQLTTLMTLQNISEDDLKSIDGVEVVENKGGHIYATALRHRAFTAVAQAIARNGDVFVDIEGHEKIMVSVLTA